ncbi:MAG: tetratricopeptide repeat protein [Phycisphaeraceae bacterium]|nr:tetratricopeptide repeat protein [Phycisphaeraceae bacterium]
MERRFGRWCVPLLLCLIGLSGCQLFRDPARPADRRVNRDAPVRPAPVVPAGVTETERARRLAAQGDDSAALAAFERAIAVNPELTVAYLGAADIYQRQGDYDRAERRYGQAAALEPGNFDAQYGHGLSLHFLNRLAEAVRAYLRALAIRPNDFDTNLNLATAYLQLGEPRQAQVYAVRAVRLNTRSGPARANLGAVYAALGDHASAVAEYQQASELMELSPPLLLNWADSLSREGRHAEAINTLEEVIRSEPSAVALERLGAARFRMRQYEKAEQAFSEALRLDGNHYPAMNGLAVCLLNRYEWSQATDLQSRDEAIRLLRRSLQIEPRQTPIVELVRRYG